MPIETDLNVSPYFDDYTETKDFYKILFRPGVSVQVRELNQLQTILQKQIERFGDNVFKRGTIVDGCNFGFLTSYPYVKLVDSTVDGEPTNPALYVGHFAEDEATGLTAFITNYEDGFEASDPDLKTIFVHYNNSGTDGNTFAFSVGNILKIYDANDSIFSISVDNGGIGFSNSDEVIITSAIVVNVSSGSFTNGSYIRNATGANVQIVGVDETTLADSDQLILRLKPRDVDLANVSVNATAWTISNGEALSNAGNTIAGVVEGIVGSGAEAIIRTNGVGTVTDVIVNERGNEYSTLPVVRVRSIDNTSGLTDLDLEAQNYLTTVAISDAGDAVGNGYAFSVTGGVIYQKGYFQRVSPQVCIVEKYSQSPNALAVGFMTEEDIIDSNIDTSLLDNALGEENETAPGANRLKLTPTLTVLSTDDANANDEFFTLVEFSEGQPFKINQYTQYNKLGDEMATRTADEAGDFVIDRFNLQTRSPLDGDDEGRYFSLVIDPGTAYISGYKASTSRNFAISIEKGIDTAIANNQRIALDYGNYVRIHEVGGVFQYSTGDTVNLYDTAKSFLSNNALVAAANVDAVGTLMGTARIRSLVHEDGIPGVNSAIYQLYLFDIDMLAGKNFRDVKSIRYDGTKKGIADVKLEQDATTGANVAVIREPTNDCLLFYSGVNALKNANNVEYVYRTIDQTLNSSNAGIITKDISASPGEFFPYSGALSTSQLKELYVVPIDVALKGITDLTGNVTTATTSANLVGAGTTFLSEVEAGDFLWVYANSTGGGEVKKVVTVVNNTFLTVDSNVSFANTDANLRRYFPRHVPVPFGGRTGLSANVDANGNILTINFGMSFDTSTTSNVAVGVNIERQNATQATKTPNRQKFVKLRLANNAANTTGPWCLGVPDAFRLRGVYIAQASGVANTDTNIVDQFYIDHNQNANFYNLSFLYKRPDSNYALTSSDYLLVEFDYFTSTSGFYDTVSYLSANLDQITLVDSQPLSNLSSSIHSFEIPEVYTNKGVTFDLKNQLDFRPVASNTAAPHSTHGSAPLNPDYTVGFGNTADAANDKKFPLPGTTFQAQIEQFLGRRDSVYVNRDTNIFVLKGTAAPDLKNQQRPPRPTGSMLLGVMKIPPYPNLPAIGSNDLFGIINLRIANERYSTNKLRNKVITLESNNSYNITTNQPARFTQADIGAIERRVRNLEYYVSLTALESDIRERVIPSSVDPALDRFKYGFLVDDFTSTRYLDLDNPQFNATIVADDLVPGNYAWSIPGPNSGITCAYIDQPIIIQNNCTDSGPTVNCTPDGLLANTLAIRQQKSTTEMGNGYPDTYNVTMGNTTGGVSLFYYCYNKPDLIQVYQGNTLLRTSNDSIVLTAADITYLQSNAVPSNWMRGADINLNSQFVLTGAYTTKAGKLQWTHNPSNGREYSIKVTKGASDTIWRYVLQYPINTSTVDCPFPPQPNNPTPTVYEGIMTMEPSTMQVVFGQVTYQNSGDGLPDASGTGG